MILEVGYYFLQNDKQRFIRIDKIEDRWGSTYIFYKESVSLNELINDLNNQLHYMMTIDFIGNSEIIERIPDVIIDKVKKNIIDEVVRKFWFFSIGHMTGIIYSKPLSTKEEIRDYRLCKLLN
jgi:hypothetical protein